MPRGSGGKEGAFPNATSPELLEDFRLAQQCLQPLEWDPQAADSQDSESGESAGEGETDLPLPHPTGS